MKLVIFGLAVSSSWGNGHAALWRGLIRAFGALGHHTVFFERDVPYYAQNRDLTVLEGGRLVLYDDWEEVLLEAKRDREPTQASSPRTARMLSPLPSWFSGRRYFICFMTSIRR